MKSEHIPKATIGRLAVYIQVLENLLRDGNDVISSEKLARACSVNSSQIRKDLAYFGEFGVRGVGYYVQELITSIKQSLGIDRIWKCALIGVEIWALPCSATMTLDDVASISQQPLTATLTKSVVNSKIWKLSAPPT